MNDATEPKLPWIAFTAAVLREMTATEPNRGKRARLRRGLSPMTEARAAADVEPYVAAARSELHGDRQAAVLYRLGGLISSHPRTPHHAGRRLGPMLSAASRVRLGATGIDPDRPDVIASRLAQLETQDLDEAAMTLHRVFTVAESTPGFSSSVDWYSIADLLGYWGERPTPTNRRHRGRVLTDYYRSARSTAGSPDQVENTTEAS